MEGERGRAAEKRPEGGRALLEEDFFLDCLRLAAFFGEEEEEEAGSDSERDEV